jgi:integrase
MVETALLTDAAVRRLKPGAKPRLIRDAGARSLYLVIAPRRDDDKRNAKSWMMRFRGPDGRPRKIVLGPLDLSGYELKETPQVGQPLSVAGARALAADIHRRRAHGEDVIGQHKARKIRRRTEAAERPTLTFGASAVEFFRDYKTEWHTRPRRWQEDARALGLAWPRDADPAKQDPENIKGGLAERWADKPVAEIDEADILAVVDDARKHGIPGLHQRNMDSSESRGRRVHAALSVLFRWLRAKRRVVRNPCRDVSHPGAPPQRDRVLSDDELRWFWAACDAEPLYAPLLRLLLLSGQRLGEVGGMRWSEIGYDKATWTIPGTRAKNHREHIVPLAPSARELLLAKQKDSSSDLIFTTTGETPLSGGSRLKRRLDRAMLELARQERGAETTIPPWRLHDLRRSFVTGLSELRIRDEVVELCVNHVSGKRGGVAGTYNKAKLLPERKEAFERWALHLAGVVEPRPANVTQLAGRKAGRAKA